MRNRFLYGFLFLLFVLSDQVTKLATVSRMHLGESYEVLGDFLRLTYVKNPGGAFSVSFGGPQIMFVITMTVIALLIYLYVKGILRPETVWGKIALVMVFSGAVGNFIDRIRVGEVTDFIDMGLGGHRWPVYNVADILITAGMILLFFTYSRKVDAPEGEPFPPA